jgi:dynein light chain Tctex-type 1
LIKQNVVKKVVESTLQDAEYSHGKVPGWNNAITEGCMKKLKEMNKNYKYIGGSSHQTSTI